MKVWSIAAALILAAAGASCDSEKGQGADKEMSTPMQTQCVGRYLIDVPDTFAWTESPDATLYYGLGSDHKTIDAQIIDSDSNPEKFGARVRKRADAIAKEVNAETGGSMLIENKGLDRHRVLLNYYRTAELDRSQTYEVHVLSGRTHILLKTDSFPEDKEPAEIRLVRLSTQIRNEVSEKSSAPGLCLGPVVINADHDHEEISTYARDKRRPDVLLSVYMSASTPDQEEGLIEQIEREKEAFSTGPKFLRKGRTNMGGMDAEEALMRFDEDGISMHSFAIWSKRQSPSFARPTITLNLNTGGEVSSNPRRPDPLRYGVLGEVDLDDSKTVSSSLSDQEATMLWDTIVRSVRLRPGAADK